MPVPIRAALALLAFIVAIPASAAFHLWTMNELYSNADGSVQFLEVTAPRAARQPRRSTSRRTFRATPLDDAC